LVEGKSKVHKFLHGTSYKAIGLMFKKEELIPQGSIGSLALESPELYNEEDYKGFLFFTDFLPLAVDYGTMAAFNTGQYLGNLIPVLEVELDEAKLLPDTMDAKEARDWKESLEMVNQIKTKGNLPTNCITRILIVDYDTIDIMYEFRSYKNYKEAITEIKNKK
jgi:RNA binding exosome subunit